jgi:7,8-dihydropterin-6-yl-methyl-4-(beta-D-ribofuranosyl)aminobenzene 5'-phosphate synthase
MRLSARWVAGIALVAAAAVAAYFLVPGLLGGNEAAESEAALSLVERSGRFTILYDNNPFNGSCSTEWGFSCLVELGNETVLFDTGGDPEVLARNVEALGVQLVEVDYLVLSHEHWDHVGGLSMVLAANSDVTVYLLESFPYHIKSRVRGSGATLVETWNATLICPGVATTRVLEAEPDEQALMVNTGGGLVLVTGCSHPGVQNLVRAAENATGLHVCFVFGGFHLGDANRASLDSLVAELKDLGVERAAPTHCSGDLARLAFREGYGEDCVELGVGWRMGF